MDKIIVLKAVECLLEDCQITQLHDLYGNNSFQQREVYLLKGYV